MHTGKRGKSLINTGSHLLLFKGKPCNREKSVIEMVKSLQGIIRKGGKTLTNLMEPPTLTYPPQQVEAEFSPIPSMKKIVPANVSSPGPSFGQE